MSDFVRLFRIGPHRVKFTVPLSGPGECAIRCEWDPLPRKLSKKRIAEYLVKCDACLRAFATWAGISIFVGTPNFDDYKTIFPEP